MKVNYIKVFIPQQFDFQLYGIETKEDKQRFLQKMCDDSINAPIIQNGKAIGIIAKSEINELGEGIISSGTIWCNIEYELARDDSGFRFSATYLESI